MTGHLHKRGPEVVLITGPIDSGKTTSLERLVEIEKTKGNSPTGIIGRGVFDGEAKIGFDAVDVSAGSSWPLARIGKEIKDGFSVGKFTFSNEALELAQATLLNFRQNGVVFLDEVGPLELAGEGYADCLRTLLDSNIARLYISVRSECLQGFEREFLGSIHVTIVSVTDFDRKIQD